MIGKKINQLATELAPASTDLTIIGNPTTGVSKKITLAQLGAIFSGAVSFYTNYASFPATGTLDVIFCAKDTQKLYLWSGSAYVEVFPSQALLDTYQLRSEKGNANGYASLDSSGKVPVSQLPSSIMEYKGTWSAATNTPTLANGTGDTGDVYICNAAGSVNFGAGAITFAVGDYVIYSGSIWQRSSGAVGTVTSVAASITGNALTISGSPVTTSGTLAFAFAGTGAQYIKGDGTLATFPSIISQAQNLVSEVYNNTGATLTKGTVVYINGGQGNLPTVTKAIATGDSTSAQTYGIVQADITNNNNGYVVVAGRLENMDTQALANGTQLYLSSTTAGAYTSTKQYAPAHLVYVGIIVRSHPTQGVIEVKIQNGYELDELHDVSAQSPSNGDILQYVSSTGLWTKKTGSTTNIAEGTNLYYTEARVNANTNVAANTAARHNAVTIGTANGLSLSTQVLSLALASGSTTGALSSTDWNTFNNKQAAGNYVTLDTFQTITASKTFSVGFSLASAGGSNQITSFVNANSIHSGSSATNVFGFNNSNNIYFGKGLSNGGVITFNNAAVRFYALQDASGTLAFTSDLTGGTVTSVGLSSATSGVTIGSSPVTTSGTITLAIATASGSQQGLLSSTDWTTFNNKQNALTNPVTGTGTTNYLPKFTGTSTIGNSLLTDDAVELRYSGADGIRVQGSTSGFVSIYGTADNYLQFIDAGGAAGAIQYNHTSDYMAFKVAGANRMRLDASGNLGLGVTPSAWGYGGNFQFKNIGTQVDAFNIAGNAYDNSGWKYASNGYATINSQDQGRHIWYTAPSGTAGNAISFTQAMTLNASGNLSIGNTNDTYKLDVSGTGRFTNGVISDTLFRANNGVYQLWRVGGFRGGLYTYDGVTGSGTDYTPTFYSESDLYFVSGGIATRRLIISSAGAATFSSSIDMGLNKLFTGGGYKMLYRNSTVNITYSGTSNWQINNDADNVALMTVLNGGNVGIGTTSPTAKLQITSTSSGAATVAAFLVNESVTTNTEVRLAFAANTNNDISSGRYSYISALNTSGSNGQALLFATNEAGNSAVERMRISSGGVICVGKTDGTFTNVGHALFQNGQVSHVTNSDASLFLNRISTDGDIVLFYRNSSSVGSIAVTTSSTSFNTSSDYRLKQDLKDFNGLDLINKIKTYDYEWKADKTRSYGVIAHELQSVINYAVTGVKDGKEMQGVDYSKIVPVLIKAIQELNDKIK